MKKGLSDTEIKNLFSRFGVSLVDDVLSIHHLLHTLDTCLLVSTFGVNQELNSSYPCGQRSLEEPLTCPCFVSSQKAQHSQNLDLIVEQGPQIQGYSISEPKGQGKDPPSAELEREETGVVTGYKTIHSHICASNTLRVTHGIRSPWRLEALR